MIKDQGYFITHIDYYDFKMWCDTDYNYCLYRCNQLPNDIEDYEGVYQVGNGCIVQAPELKHKTVVFKSNKLRGVEAIRLDNIHDEGEWYTLDREQYGQFVGRYNGSFYQFYMNETVSELMLSICNQFNLDVKDYNLIDNETDETLLEGCELIEA